jgi:hypothetical protein
LECNNFDGDDHLDNEPRRRGRPRKVLPPPKPRPPLVHRISEWRRRTGESRWKVLERIRSGQLKVAVKGNATSPYLILVSEYQRLGFVQSLDELV